MVMGLAHFFRVGLPDWTGFVVLEKLSFGRRLRSGSGFCRYEERS